MIPDFDLALNDTEDFDIVAAGAVFAMGVSVVEPSGAYSGGSFVDTCGVTAGSSGCVETTFEITIRNGSALLGTQTVNFANDTLSFFGIWSDQAFDRLEIRDTSNNADDEFFGEVYTGTRALVAVPEPGTVRCWSAG